MTMGEQQMLIVWAWIAGLKKRGPASKDLAEELETLLCAVGDRI